MISSTVVAIVLFVMLYAVAERLGRDPLGWCILGLFITPIGSLVAMILYTWIVGD